MRTRFSILIIGYPPHKAPQTLADVGWRAAHIVGLELGSQGCRRPQLWLQPRSALRRGRCRTLDPRPGTAKGAGERDGAERGWSPALCPLPVRNTDRVFRTQIRDLELRSSALYLQKVETEERISLPCTAQTMKLPIRRNKSASSG